MSMAIIKILIIIFNILIFAVSWFSTANYFSRRGFSGLLLSLPHDSQLMNIDNAADYLEKKRYDTPWKSSLRNQI